MCVCRRLLNYKHPYVTFDTYPYLNGIVYKMQINGNERYFDVQFVSVYTLKDMCKQVVSSHYTSEQLKKLSPAIPSDLFRELLHRDPSVPSYSDSQN